MRLAAPLLVVSLVLAMVVMPSPPAASAAAPAAQTLLDWDVPGGHFFSQTGGGTGQGFFVLDDDEARMSREFYRLGGEAQLGYPISARYEADGLVHQAFQRAVLRWRPEARRAELVDVFRQLSNANLDSWLAMTFRIPFPRSWEAQQQGKSPEEIMQLRQSILDGDEEMKAYYFAAEDPVAVYGLPMSDIIDLGDHTLLRLERAVFQKWKKDMPFAPAGTVTLVLAGNIARTAALIPSEAARTVNPQEEMGGERWIDVDRTAQRATAFVGLKAVHVARVATGVPGWETPKGKWKISSRVPNETMDSATIGIPRNAPFGYYLKDVLFTQYFAPGGVALHYNYWTPASQFGTQVGSHGCVGMMYDDALALWEFGAIGMRVSVHD